MKPNINLFLFHVLLCAFGISISSAQAPAEAQTSKTIYLAPDDHTDYFWTADDVQYRAAFIETLDYYLDRIDQSADHPPEFQPKWNCDGSLWLWEYEHHKTKLEFQRLMSRVADGHISSPLNALVSTYGGQPAEAVLRGMYYAGDLERRFDVRFPLAVAMENQTLPLGLGSLWSGAGAKYSWRGICGCATKMPYPPFQNRDHEIYWWRGLDDSRILMKWYSLGDNNESIGGYAEARKPDKAIDFITTNQGFLKRHPYATVGLFGQGWDDLKTLGNSFPSIARRRTTKDQKVIVSNEEDFFRAFERRHGGDLPVVTEAYGNEWDILPASMAKQTARVRRAVERLRTAEAIAAIINRYDANFWPQRKTQRDLAHMNLGLYWEHDWTADSTEALRTKRAQWQKRLADQISQYVDQLLIDSQAKLASLVTHKPSSESVTKSYLIFNPLGVKRDVTVKLEADFLSGIEIVDVNTNAVLDYETIDVGVVMVRVKDVPPVGFTTIEVKQKKHPGLSLAEGNQNWVENSKFKVVVDARGTISSLIEKETGRELAGPAGLNVLTIDGQSATSDARVVVRVYTMPNKLTIQRTSRTRGQKILHIIKSQTIITLSEDHDVLIENTILQNFSPTLSWNFDFKLNDFQLEHEEVGAIVKADLVSEGGHYANRNARYDWLSAGHFVRLREEKFAVDIANHDCSFFKFGQSTPRKLDTAHPQVQFLIGGQIDGPDLGIRNQNGDRTFTQRFTIGTAQSPEGFSGPASLSPLVWAVEQTNPAVTIELNSNSDGKLPTKYSLIQSNPNDAGSDIPQNVILWAVKPAENNSATDTIMRWWNVADSDSSVALECSGLLSIQPTSHIETDLLGEKRIASDDSKRFTLPFSKHQMRTFRLKFASSSE